MRHTSYGRLKRTLTPCGGIRLLRYLIGVAMFCLVGVPPHPSRAQFTPRDGQIIARTLSFTEASVGGTLEIGIAYAPDHPISVRQAESLKAAIGESLAAGKVTLKARLIPVGQLGSTTNIAGIFVTGDLGPHLDDVVLAAQRLHVPTISTEMACVRTAHCILGFSTQPTVEIVLNHEAANNAGVHFTQAFRMLVREL